jgi:hypothetical protein
MQANYGQPPERVHLSGWRNHVRFDSAQKSGRRRLGSHLLIVAKHDLQKLAPAVLSDVESEVLALIITVAEKAFADSCGFTIRIVLVNRLTAPASARWMPLPWSLPIYKKGPSNLAAITRL